MSAFSNLLRQLRTLAGLSQRQLASASGIDRTAISQLENGRRPAPARDKVIALAAALRLPSSQTDQLLEAAGYEPEVVLDIPGLDFRDQQLRDLLRQLADVRAQGGEDWLAGVQGAVALLLQGARQRAALPLADLAAAPPTDVSSLTPEDEALDDLLGAILAGEDDEVTAVEQAIAGGRISWEMRRRVSETLPALAAIDAETTLRIAGKLRSDYDPDMARADVRRRVVEAVPALHAVAPQEAVALLNRRDHDEIYVGIAAIEVLAKIDAGPEAGRIRKGFVELERTDQAGVIEFAASLLDLCERDPDAALDLVRTVRELSLIHI